MIVTINNIDTEAKQGEYLLAVIRRAGFTVPTLCHIEGLHPIGSCRMCIVESLDSGELISSCSTFVYENMRVVTNSQRALKARKAIAELLLTGHPDDCKYCSRRSNCELLNLAEITGIDGRNLFGSKKVFPTLLSNPAIVFEPDKCILCGRCVGICSDIIGLPAIKVSETGLDIKLKTEFADGWAAPNCIYCGQCILNCPTAALAGKSSVEKVLEALDQKDLFVTVQYELSASVAISEEFGEKSGVDFTGKMVKALNMCGFDRVFDSSFGADLKTLKESEELVSRIKSGKNLPMVITCCESDNKYIQRNHPDLYANIYSAGSSQENLGKTIKYHIKESEKIPVEKIINVAIVSCTSKKFLAENPAKSGIDFVLTTREAAELIRIKGINLNIISEGYSDNPFNNSSSAAKLTAVSGGAIEAIMRSVYFKLTNKELTGNNHKKFRNFSNIKTMSVEAGNRTLTSAAITQPKNLNILLSQIKSEGLNLDLLEVDACPGGCAGGGGQPYTKDMLSIQSRIKSVYKIEKDSALWACHNNRSLAKFIGYSGEKFGEGHE